MHAHTWLLSHSGSGTVTAVLNDGASSWMNILDECTNLEQLARANAFPFIHHAHANCTRMHTTQPRWKKRWEGDLKKDELFNILVNTESSLCCSRKVELETVLSLCVYQEPRSANKVSIATHPMHARARMLTHPNMEVYTQMAHNVHICWHTHRTHTAQLRTVPDLLCACIQLHFELCTSVYSNTAPHATCW